MNAQAPAPPLLHAWPPAQQSAALRRGLAVACGPGLRLISWPETPTVRAAAIGAAFTPCRIAAHLTAAWIWGAAWAPGDELEFAVASGRPHDFTPGNGTLLHQYRLAHDDVARLGPFAVTSPRRTLYDMLRAEHFGATQRLACRMLLTHSTDGRSSFIAELPRHRPHHRRVIERLSWI